MKEYMKPSVALIAFDSEVKNWDIISGCNCFYSIESNQMTINGQTPSCKLGETGHASENPFGVSAPNWTFG